MILSKELYFNFSRRDLSNNYLSNLLAGKSQSQKIVDLMLFNDLLSDEDDKLFVIKKTTIDLSTKLKLDKAIKDTDYSFLFSIKDEKGVYLLGEKFYKYEKDGDTIKLFIATQKDNYFKYHYCYIKADRLIMPDKSDEFNNELEAFLKLYIFINLSDTEVINVPAKQKYGTKKTGNYLNDTNKNILIVDTTWNKIINVGSFMVSHHFRLQPCGENFKYRKLILIDSYSKNGYTINKKSSVI